MDKLQNTDRPSVLGPKGAGRGSEKPTSGYMYDWVTRGLLDRLYGRLADIKLRWTVVWAAQLARPSTDSSKQPAWATVLLHPYITAWRQQPLKLCAAAARPRQAMARPLYCQARLRGWPTKLSALYYDCMSGDALFMYRPVSRSHFSPTPADSVLSHYQPTHIG